jgi:predicted nuclease of restriction endonuclease-like RecB superfamily
MSTVRFPHLGFNSSNLLLAREISVRVIQVFISFDKPQKISIRINQVFKSYCWQRKKISMRVIQVFKSVVGKETKSVSELLKSLNLLLAKKHIISVRGIAQFYLGFGSKI